MSAGQCRTRGLAHKFRMCEPFGMIEPLTISDLRAELGLTLSQMAERLGLASKGQVSEIERNHRCSLAVALRIEELANGRIDAADLSEDVRQARAACRHGCDIATASPAPSPGENDEDSPSVLNQESVA